MKIDLNESLYKKYFKEASSPNSSIYVIYSSCEDTGESYIHYFTESLDKAKQRYNREYVEFLTQGPDDSTFLYLVKLKAPMSINELKKELDYYERSYDLNANMCNIFIERYTTDVIAETGMDAYDDLGIDFDDIAEMPEEDLIVEL